MSHLKPVLYLLGSLAMAPIPSYAAVIASPIGTPSFVPTDFHLFSAPSGTAADGFAAFGQTQQALLPPPNHVPNPALGIGPGQPHAGPYDQEFAQGVAANGFVDSTQFTTAQYSGGNAVYLVFMAVPGAGSSTGSSPNSPSGRILANAIFPLTVDGTTLTDGVANDVLGQFTVPPINTVPEFVPAALDGYSHVPFFFLDNFDFASRPVTGAYEYRISITDAAGNGYLVSAPFQVIQAVPEPASWLLVGFGGLALTALRYRFRTGNAVR